MMLDVEFLLVGYCVSVLVEMPVLLAMLSASISTRRRLLAGFWLTACTYPIVVLVIPRILTPGWQAIAGAESFAAIAECLLFEKTFGDPRRSRSEQIADASVVVAANLASFLVGECLHAFLPRWWRVFPW